MATPSLQHVPASVRQASAFRVLGVRVDAVQIAGVVLQMEDWIARRESCQYIAVTGMHGVTEAQHDARFKAVLNSAGLVVPDGMPLVWISRWLGFNLRRRVYGPELMASFCEQTAAKRYRHFFYGGAPGVAEELASRMVSRFPGVVVAGTYSPPFRVLTREEDREVVAAIEAARADVVWVGLSTPKQERWMHEHRDKLNVPVLVGVGAAFDFHWARGASSVVDARAWVGVAVQAGERAEAALAALFDQRLGVCLAGVAGINGLAEIRVSFE